MDAFIFVVVLGLLIFLLISVLLTSERQKDFKRKITSLEERIKQLEKKDYGKPAEPRLNTYQPFQSTPNVVASIPKQSIEEKVEIKETPVKLADSEREEVEKMLTPEIVEEVNKEPEITEETTLEQSTGNIGIEETLKNIEEAAAKEEITSEPEQEEEFIFAGKEKPEVESIGYAYSRMANTKPVAVPKKKSDFWAKTEKQFIENWTGILGAVIMVAGVVFFGIYAALKVNAFFRFLLITGFAVLLIGAFIYLKRHDKWVKLAEFWRLEKDAEKMLEGLVQR